MHPEHTAAIGSSYRLRRPRTHLSRSPWVSPHGQSLRPTPTGDHSRAAAWSPVCGPRLLPDEMGRPDSRRRGRAHRCRPYLALCGRRVVDGRPATGEALGQKRSSESDFSGAPTCAPVAVFALGRAGSSDWLAPNVSTDSTARSSPTRATHHCVSNSQTVLADSAHSDITHNPSCASKQHRLAAVQSSVCARPHLASNRRTHTVCSRLKVDQ